MQRWMVLSVPIPTCAISSNLIEILRKPTHRLSITEPGRAESYPLSLLAQDAAGAECTAKPH